MSERPLALSREAERDASTEDLLFAMGDPGVLEALGMTLEDLESARGDGDLLETLRITHEVLLTLRDADVLDVFFHLPVEDQKNFLRWIAGMDDLDLRHVRAVTFVSALKMSPLGPGGNVPEIP